MNATIYTNEEKWKTATEIVNELQYISSSQETTIEDLMQKLGDYFPKDFPVKGVHLSVIYRPYVSPNNYRILVLRGLSQKPVLAFDNSPFVTIENTVKDIVDGKKNHVLETNADGNLSKLLECTGLIIVPMRVDRERIIGAFILESTLNEEVLTENDGIVLDRISDRLAFLVQFIDQKRRSEIIHNFLAELTENATFFQCESNILKAAIANLLGRDNDGTNVQSSESWFSGEELSLILQHPFYNDRVYLPCENGSFTENFRNDFTKKDDLHKLLGENIDTLLQAKEIIICNDEDAIEKHGLPAGYLSYAIVPMAIRDRVIGLFILRNRYTRRAYQDEKPLLEQFAKFTTITLRDFRANRFSQQRRDFRKKFIRGQELIKDEKLYDECLDIITKIFGVTDFFALSIDRESIIPKQVYPSNIKIEFNNDLKEDIEGYITDVDSQVNHSKGDIDEATPVPIKSNGKYSIFSTRAESGRLTNIILIGSNHPLGKSTTAFLKELFAIISFKQSLDRKKKRLIALTEFGKAITAVDFDQKTYLDKLYRLIVSNFSENIRMESMYIALLGNDNMISFPLFMKKTENSFDRLKIDSRPFDKNTQAPARTEYILINDEPILINSLDESIQWYKEHGNSEKIKDPFASWIGVPIFEENKAIGVIAVYHPFANYLYTRSDIIFLENIAVHISNLLARLKLESSNLELKESNRKLEAAQAKIANQQEIISSYLERSRLKEATQKILTDITLVFRRLDFFAKDIKSYQTPRSIEKLLSLVDQGKQRIQEYKKAIDSSTSPHEETYLPELIHNIVFNEEIPKNLRVKIDTNSLEPNQLRIKADYKAITQSIFIILSYIISESGNRKDNTSLIVNFDNKNQDIVINIFSENLDSMDENGFHAIRARQLLTERLESTFVLDKQNCTVRITLKAQQPDKKALLIIKDDLWREELSELLKLNNLKCEFAEHGNNDFSGFLLVIIDEASYKWSDHKVNEKNTSSTIAILVDDEKSYYPYPSYFKRLYKASESVQTEEGFAKLLTEWGIR